MIAITDLKAGDLIFDKEKSILGNIIRWTTKSWSNHIALYIGNNEIIEVTLSGVKINSLNKYFNPLFHKIRVFRINTSQDNIQKMIDYSKEMHDLKYDYLQIFSLFILSVFKLKSELTGIERQKFTICSELIAIAGQKAGIKFCNLPISNIMPDDIMKSSLIYEL